MFLTGCYRSMRYIFFEQQVGTVQHQIIIHSNLTLILMEWTIIYYKCLHNLMFSTGNKWVKIGLIKLLTTYAVYWTWFSIVCAILLYLVMVVSCVLYAFFSLSVDSLQFDVSNDCDKTNKTGKKIYALTLVCFLCALSKSVKQLEKVCTAYSGMEKISERILGMTIRFVVFFPLFSSSPHAMRYRMKFMLFLVEWYPKHDFIL